LIKISLKERSLKTSTGPIRKSQATSPPTTTFWTMSIKQKQRSSLPYLLQAVLKQKPLSKKQS
jgi:hypothetical protein